MEEMGGGTLTLRAYTDVQRQDIRTQIALLGKLTFVDMQDCTYGIDSSSCSKMWISRTS